MSDLISREQAIKLLSLNKPNVDEKTKYAMWQFDKDLQTIKTMPSAEKTGKWTKIEYADEVNGYLIPNYECSQCGYWSIEDYDYCPNCGSRMEE